MIEPALTPAEWAEQRKRMEIVAGWSFEVARETDHTLGHDIHGVVWVRAPLAGRELGVPLEAQPALAALCLHGRITWAMVGVLRDHIAYAAKVIAGEEDVLRTSDNGLANNPVDAARYREWATANLPRLRSERAARCGLADLLESLLSPRGQ